MPDLYHWAQLFRATTWEEILMLAEKNENIKECIVTLKELTEDEKIQLECEARERSRLDYLAATRYGEKMGMEQGIDKMSKLNILLLKENKVDELTKASEDEEYRELLFTKYNL